MLKTLLLLILLTCGNNSYSIAQGFEVEFNDLQTPASPGFALLDETPESIARPSTPQGLALNFISLVQGSGAALEVAPYWLKVHEGLDAKKQLSNLFPFGQTFSLSAATVKNENTTFVAGGMRFRFLRLYSDKQLQDYQTHLGAINSTALAIARNKVRQVQVNDSVSKLNNSDGSRLLKLELMAKLETLKKEADDIASNFDEPAQKGIEVIENPFFSIDFAAALGGGSETDSYKDLQLQKWAVWTNLNFSWSDKFSSTLLGRYLDNLGSEIIDEAEESEVAEFQGYDLGGRLNWDIARKICLSAEYIQRFYNQSDISSQNRLAAIGSFKIYDNVYATATFGKNFGEVQNIIALGGITLGISENKQTFIQ